MGHKVFETGVNAVQAGTRFGGWVSGDLANLAASATVNALFDLGDDWESFVFGAAVIFPSSPSTGLGSVQVFGRPDGVAGVYPSRRLKDPASTGASTNLATITTGPGPQQITFRPMGRYVVISATNSDATNAQGGSGKITLAVYTS